MCMWPHVEEQNNTKAATVLLNCQRVIGGNVLSSMGCWLEALNIQAKLAHMDAASHSAA